MSDNSEPQSFSDAERDRLRKLISRQYLLHETDHHSPGEISEQPDCIIPGVYTLMDVYKCLHQGEFGIGHSIDDPAGFKERLAREYYRQTPVSNEPVLENISPDDSVFRVNMRPFRHLYKDNEEEGCNILYQACLDSAAIEKGNNDHFLMMLSEFRRLNNENQIKVGRTAYSFPPGQVKDFFLDIRRMLRSTGNIPVFSHSPVYREFNLPSYRVIDAAVFEIGPLRSILENQER